MTKLKYKIINYNEILKFANDQQLTKGAEDYNIKFKNLLIDIDIFHHNYRTDSNKQMYRNYDLFEEVEVIDSETLIIFSMYLEVFQYSNKMKLMIDCIEHFSKKYINNKLLCQWNHDMDWANYGKDIEKYINVYILNFGYVSKKFKNNILVPFWDINTIPYKEPKKIFTSFIGTINNKLRYDIASTIINSNNPNFYYNRIYGETFFKIISSSKFTLCPRGGEYDGGFSYRFFETFSLNCVPVLISDKTIYPYNDIDWDSICVKIPEIYATDLQEIYNILISKDYDKMIKNINNIKHRFSLQGIQEEIYYKFIK